MKTESQFAAINTQRNLLILIMLVAPLFVVMFYVFIFSARWMIILSSVMLVAAFSVFVFLDMRKGLLLFVISLATAPPLYLILPASPIFRSIRLYELLLALIFIFALIRSTEERKEIFYNTPIDIPVLMIVLLWTLSILNGLFLQQGFNARDFFELMKPIRLFILLQLVIYITKDREDLERMIYFLIIFSLYPQILGIFEHFHLFNVRRFLATVYPGYEYSSIIAGGFDVYGAGFLHKFRSSSVFVGDVNAFGGYSALFFLMALIFCVYMPRVKNKILLALISLFNLYGVLLSGSRKAVFCVGLGLLVFLVFKVKKAFKAFPVYVVSFFVVLRLTPTRFTERLFEHWEYKINNLIRLWDKYTELSLSSLVIGNGAVHEFGIDSFHLKLLLRGGMLGLLAHFILVFFILKTAINLIRNSRERLDEMVGMMALTLTIGIEWLNVTGLYFYCGRISESFWIILGALFVLYRWIQAEKT
jgi:hypothetical protein